ncbi:MAG: alanine--tRNA ligase-related protein [Pseudomonadota bacterium]|nr:alanine--tRNA ligase-related protein [Pseudomonadota bacterium]
MSSCSDPAWNGAVRAIPQSPAWESLCAEVESGFLNHFAALGYRLYPEEPLLPATDPTLLFTNSFIVALKPLIRQGLVHEGERLVMRQACLRTQNLHRHPLDCSPMAYGSRFEMVGGLVGVAHLPALLFQLYSFLERSGVAGRLRMKASTSTEFFLLNCADTPWHGITSIDDEPESYYRWGYGEPGLYGRGVTFALPSEDRSETGDFGNIVELVYDGSTIGYEFGFGVETFVSRKHGVRNSIAVGPLADLPGRWSAPQFDYMKDLLRIAHTLHCLGITAGKGGVRQIMRKTCRALAQQLDAGFATEEELIIALEHLRFPDITRFMRMLRGQQHLVRQQTEAAAP